jgi:hypothetical protein
MNLLKVNAGISDDAAIVYKHILIVGSLTIGEVCEYASLGLEPATKALEELVNARLIRRLTHVVDRYVAVAPYRAFAEHLVTFQRTMKEVEENAKKSIDSTLAEISKTNEQFKAGANKLREEEVSRTKLETQKLMEEAETARKDLTEKLRRETETKKSTLTEMLKKHIDEHSTRITELGKDTTLRLDNSVAKFNETTTKLKEQASQSTSSYLNRFEERIQAFVKSVDDGLATFQSGFYAFAENHEREASLFLEDFNAKAEELSKTINTKANDLLRGVGQTLAKLSSDLETTITSQVDAGISRSSSSNTDLESSIQSSFQTHGEKLSQAFTAFQTAMQVTMDRWRTTNKEELQRFFNTLKETMANNLQNVSQKLELTKTPMSEVQKNYLTSVENSSDELKSGTNGLVESIKKELTDKIGTAREELQAACDTAAKDCSLLVTALDSLSKKNIPLTSKTLADFNSDLTTKLSKMFNADIENAESFSEEIKQRTLKLVSMATPLSASTDHPKKTGVTQDDLRKEISEKIDEITSDYIEAARKSVETSEKYTFAKINTTMKFEEELEKKWGSVTNTMAKVSNLTEAVTAFPQTLGRVLSELTVQYGKKVEATVSSTRRLLNVHSKTLEDETANTLKKWGVTIEKTMKELHDTSTKRQDELGEMMARQTNALDIVLADNTRGLTEIISKEIDGFRSENLNAQTLTARHIASNTEDIGGCLRGIQNKLKEALETTQESFNTTVESKCKENDDMSIGTINETSRVIASMKENLKSLIKTKKDLAKQICETTGSDLRQIASDYVKQLHDIASSLTSSFTTIVDAVNEGYKKESESTKTALIATLSQHIKNYTEAVNKVAAELNSTLTKHFDDCRTLTQGFGIRINELLTLHQTKYEAASNRMVEGLTTAVDQDEAVLNASSNRMLKEFTDNTTRTAKEASSIENLMRTAWAEITDTQQINADKTWHYVTKRAILSHMKDMVKRTKSTVTVVVPDIEEAPLKEVKEISKAIRIQIIAGVDENLHRKPLKELFMQGNVRIWSLAEKDYISCTRDAEEVLIAPVARKDTDCVATVSVEENYVKLYHKFIGPMWMASSREIREKSLG